MNELSDITEQRIIEIQRLVDKFQSEFKEGTSDPDHFMSMSDIERLWEELKNSTEKIYSDMVMELLLMLTSRNLSLKKRHSIWLRCVLKKKAGAGKKMLMIL